jgi:hypothetical protein
MQLEHDALNTRTASGSPLWATADVVRYAPTYNGAVTINPSAPLGTAAT